jgi:hypothetical protein
MSATVNPRSEPSPNSADPWGRGHAIELLRIGVGAVWLVNLLFIVDPANMYWSTFSATALSFAPTTVGGPGLAQYVAAHPLFFSWGIALVTGYLALSLLFGFTTRLACFLGSFFSAILLATQFGTTFLFPGGTDVGAHPLYILVYGVLVVGGAGQSLSVDHWVHEQLRLRRAARPAPSGARPHPWATAIPVRTLFVYFLAGTLVSLGVGVGLVVALPATPATSGSPPIGPVTYVNLSVNINPTNGWPQYSPANFTVPTGRVVFTIVDNDSPMAWNECPCPVDGTVGGVEMINGTAVGRVSGANVAHTLNIPVLGLQVLSPGQSTVQFAIDLVHSGEYIWYCFAPCGTGTDPYNTPPMDVPGFMTGTMTVT